MWHTFTNLENRKKTCEKQNTILAILCDLFGMVKWPLQRLSDLQLGDKKSTLNHLDCQVKKIQTSSLRAAFSMVPFSMVQWWPSVLLHMYDMFLESGSKPAFSLSFLSCLKKTRHVSSLTFSSNPPTTTHAPRLSTCCRKTWWTSCYMEYRLPTDQQGGGHRPRPSNGARYVERDYTLASQQAFVETTVKQQRWLQTLKRQGYRSHQGILNISLRYHRNS